VDVKVAVAAAVAVAAVAAEAAVAAVAVTEAAAHRGAAAVIVELMQFLLALNLRRAIRRGLSRHCRGNGEGQSTTFT
jgi:hypothetical protein